ncbi:MAG: Nramp family divalent metal transporter [Bacteroidota bacterium]
MFKKIGPGVLIAAAFIGPGTITACTSAGVTFRYALLWALLLSILATMALQEMAARIGIVSQKGLAAVIRSQLKEAWTQKLVVAIILMAILLGNAAYEAGNIGGASLGMEVLFGERYMDYYPLGIGFFAFVLLWVGNYKVLENTFIALVLLMSISFLVTAVWTTPPLGKILKGLLLPDMPSESLFMVMALVGTSVVPYNLFLHAALVNEKWKAKTDLKAARWDTIIAIGLGGLVSMAIMIVAAAIPTGAVKNAFDLAKGLQPLFGDSARYFMGIGLFAAGITSAITAPLAAAYVANSCFGWKATLKDWKFRLVWGAVLFLGVFFLSFDIQLIKVIKFAQIANGILLPLIAFLLVWVANKKEIMGKYQNGYFQNTIGFLIIALALFLGVKSILKVLGLL